MKDQVHRAIAIVGVGAVLPDAPSAGAFWENVSGGRYSISETPVDRWDPALYYDPDPKAPDKTYSKIGGWVRDFSWEPLKWKLPIPPRVAEAMDRTQKWSIMSAREALLDYGYPERPLDGDRTAVILGNAMAGDQHYKTALRIFFPELTRELDGAPSFQALPEDVQKAIVDETLERVRDHYPNISEDTMPGELANIIAGRVAAVFNFRGPNFTADAACASAMAAISSAIAGLEEGDYDAVLTGGIDSNMSAPSYTKFCKIGALSATGTRPYDEGADGFVMGEGAAVFLLKRLEDAEQDGDRVYAVIRGVGGSSDGKGKGITAPNPIGQRFAIERAWSHAGEDPATVSLIEGHGTSTRVGDVVEVQSMVEAFSGANLPDSSIPIGSVKSNIGHLKGAAGAAGILKATLALHHKKIPPSIGLKTPNPKIGFGSIPFYVNTELKPWDEYKEVRRAGVSAFGFGGTNFHAVLEEHVPGRISRTTKSSVSVPGSLEPSEPVAIAGKAPLRGSVVLGGSSKAELADRLAKLLDEAKAGRAPEPAAPSAADLESPERLAIEFGDAAELSKRAASATKGLNADSPAVWKALRAQGVFHQSGPSPKVAFLYTGQGSQYVNMLRELREIEPIVAETFDEADSVMRSLLGKPLSDVIFVDPNDEAATAEAENALRQTAITQPAVLATDLAITRLLAAYGVTPDMVMGHSLGEYGALVAAGSLGFREALEAVSARGREMTKVSVADNGLMAAVLAPIEEVKRIVQATDGYVVVANINSFGQSVIGGSTPGVQAAVEAITAAGHRAIPLPVSHAFHTEIVAPASEPLKKELARLGVESPKIPIVTNVTGDFYPMGPDVESEMIDILGRQIASPVQFVRGLETLYDAGARVFVEVGPKSALANFADDVLGTRPDTLSLFTNHPKVGEVPSFNVALTGIYATGHGAPKQEPRVPNVRSERDRQPDPVLPRTAPVRHAPPAPPAHARKSAAASDRYTELGRLFADFLDKGMAIYRGGSGTGELTEPVVVTGASIGLPGGEKVFSDDNIDQMLHGRTFIDAIPIGLRRAMTDKKITRLVKSDQGGPRFETIDSPANVIKLAGRGGAIGLSSDFGIPEERATAMDSTTQMAIAVGLEALRDAGIPLTMRYKTTSKGTQLPDRWALPESMRDDTGVIFGSAFPGIDMFAEELHRHFADSARRGVLEELEHLRSRMSTNGGGHSVGHELDHRIEELRSELNQDGYHFDRRFLFKALSMGHSQLAEYIGARGPNTQINAACASGTQALSLAEDWIARGRCRRVVIVTADNVTSDNLLEWIGAGFLASGAAATDELLENAALPFDRRRHGLILGMGASGMVIEAAEAARERGLRPIAEVLGTVTANSAYHGSRLDIDHIEGLMEQLVARCEAEHGIDRYEIAPHTVFVSHETYTPARGGSAQAEIRALRSVFGNSADEVVIANTKGTTGHAMGAGIEDATAVKILETGVIPPVANFKEVDPELGSLNLSRGGSYPVRYALRLGAGFGSQISMSLTRWVPSPDGHRPPPRELGYETRIEDQGRFDQWLTSATGHPASDLEVVNRTLRLRDAGPTAAVHQAAPASAPSAEAAAPAPIVDEAPPSRPTSASDPVTEKVLTIVAEQTGYPSDMLDLELDLEADLGIDTVKQAETFAAVREAYDIPRDDNLELREFPTLGHVVQFVRDRRPDLAAPAATPVATPTPSAAPEPGAASDPVAEKVLSIVAEQTGYPSDMLDLELDLEADLGIDTVKQAETFAAVREAYEISRDDDLELREFPTLGHVIQFVRDRRPDLAVAAHEAPSEAQAAATGSEADSVVDEVLAVVAKVTGYPPEMLELDLDLEADLGIDTVKQAETFAAVRETYGIPRDDNLELRDFPTLNHVIGWVKEQRPAAISEEVASADTPADDVGVGPWGEPTTGLRRVPLAVLRPPLSSCKSTGVELGEGSRVVVMPDRLGVFEALAGKLETHGVEVLKIDDIDSADSLTKQLEKWKSQGSIQGVYWLPALDREAPIQELTPEAWQRATKERAKFLHASMQTLYDQVSDRGTFLVAGTRLGGKHGFDETGAFAPPGGAVAGFTKTYKREKPDSTVKVVDFEAEAEPTFVADALVEETLHDPGVCEVGHSADDRWTITVRHEEPPVERAIPLSAATVFAITGAAGSIVSAIVGDLAKASGGTFHLLDLTPKPDADDPDLVKFRGDRDALQLELFERLKQSGQKATPMEVQKQLAALERQNAALEAIEAIERAGGQAHYHRLDLLDKDAVASAMNAIREQSGRIDVLLHAAGLEISHFLADKARSEFDLVFDVKAKGWYHLLSSLGDMPLGAAVVFSSIAGRFGNAGQTDYSAANELLAKSVSSFRNLLPDTRGIVIDWTAWADIGMASRGSIPKMMELAGIDMLDPASGIRVVRTELEGGTCGEVVIGGALGILLEEWDESGGLDPDALTAARPSLMRGRVVSMGIHTGLAVESTLDPHEQPFLYDHKIGGTPVLPGVMGLEGFAEVTKTLFPEWRVSAIESVEFLAPFKFYRDEPRTLTWTAHFRTHGEDVLADCQLVGNRDIMGRREAKTHFTASVRLSRAPAGDDRVEAPPPEPTTTVTDGDIYQVYFHGPAYQVLDSAWRDDGIVVGRMRSGLPVDHQPAEIPLLIEPRLVELCFQTAGVWQIGTTGRMGLPQHIDRVELLRNLDDVEGQLHAVVTPKDGGASFDAYVADEKGHLYVMLWGYRTAELPEDVDPNKRQPLRAAMD